MLKSSLKALREVKKVFHGKIGSDVTGINWRVSSRDWIMKKLKPTSPSY